MKNSIELKTLTFTIMCVVYIFSLSQVSANTLSEPKDLGKALSLSQIQGRWQLALESDGQPEQRFYELQSVAKEMFKLSLKSPSDAKLKAWSGVMLSSFAGASLEGRGEHIAIFAKRMLEKASDQQADILDKTYLDNGMSARHALQMALAYNPSGVDENKYYAAFLNKAGSKMLAQNKRLKTDNSTQDLTHAIN